MTGMQHMINVDFHCHSHWSHDSLMTPARIVEAARLRGLDKIAITDHNSIEGALEGQHLSPEIIIIGEEIMTSSGEILALFVKENIPGGLSPRKTIDLLRGQGAFISISHPFDSSRSLWDVHELIELLPEVDAIEILNARCLRTRYNTKAAQVAKEHHLPGTAGSDGHTYMEVSAAFLRLPDFTNAAELKHALQQATVCGGLSSALVHVGSRWAEFLKRIKIVKSMRS